MPTLQYPWLLLLLPLVLLAARGPRRPAAALVLPSTALATEGRRPVRVRRVLTALRGLIGLCLVVAIAGPRLPQSGGRLSTEGIALTLVVDVAASMATEDFRWEGKAVSRLTGVAKLFRLLVSGGTGPSGIALPGRPNDLIGLVTFATHPEVTCPLTL